MLGYIIYDGVDYEKNSGYVEWLTDVAKKRGIELRLCFSDVFKHQGINLSGVKFAINRSRSYEVSLLLELNNIRVFNNSQITLLGNNKLSAYHYAKSLGIDIPKALTSWDSDGDIISKPIDGHGGVGVELISDIDLSKGSFRVQQPLIKDLKGDVRFYIIGNKIKHAVIRSSSTSFKSNYSQGGKVEIFDYTDEHIQLVETILSNIYADYVGIDFLVTKDSKLIFNEIEDVVGSRMLSMLGINDTTDLFIDHIRSSI